MKPIFFPMLMVLVLPLAVNAVLYESYSDNPEYSVVQTLSIPLTFQDYENIIAGNIKVLAMPKHDDLANKQIMKNVGEPDDYSYEYLTKEGFVLEKGFFEYPEEITTMYTPLPDGSSPGEIQEPERLTGLSILYKKDGVSVNIMSPEGKIIKEIDVAEFSGCVVDGNCGKLESSINCPADCAEKTIPPKRQESPAAALIIIVLLLIILAMGIMMLRRKK